jgi:hypothetical protein
MRSRPASSADIRSPVLRVLLPGRRPGARGLWTRTRQWCVHLLQQRVGWHRLGHRGSDEDQKTSSLLATSTMSVRSWRTTKAPLAGNDPAASTDAKSPWIPSWSVVTTGVDAPSWMTACHGWPPRLPRAWRDPMSRRLTPSGSSELLRRRGPIGPQGRLVNSCVRNSDPGL